MPKHQNHYEVLGVPNTATLNEIKKAFHKLALQHHPDKGNGVEKMSELNKAYEVLGDASLKKQYDTLESNGADAIDRMYQTKGDEGFLDTSGERFSARFRRRYETHLGESIHTPFVAFDVTTVIKPHASHLFDVSENDETPKAGGLFDYLALLSRINVTLTLPAGVKKSPLSPSYAITLLTAFVEGDYFGPQLKELYDYLMLEARSENDRDKSLYQGIANIFLIAYQETANQKGKAPVAQMSFHEALSAVTQYIKKTASFSMTFCAPLLQNAYFREIYSWGLINLHWRNPQPNAIKNSLDAYIGYDRAREELEQLLDRQRSLPDDSEVIKGFDEWVTTSKYLYLYEKNAKEQQAKPGALHESTHHIECAFQILDWFPALGQRVPHDILANLLLQAAVHMQVAGQLTTKPAERIACEKLSFELYMNAIVLADRASLDVEMYVLQHSISNMSSFHHQHESVMKVLPELTERYLFIANVFPLFEKPQSHAHFFMSREDELQATMRRLLHILVDIIRYNRSHDPAEAKPFDHEYANILYYAYEACLRRWYEDKDGKEAEIRATLMEELLATQGWNFSDLDKRLQPPHIMIARTPDGWISPTRTLALPTTEQKTAFAGLDAIEINDKTGDIHFVMRDITAWQGTEQRVISFSDIQEIFSCDVTGALLSLDEVNHHMRFHPFNKIRIVPTSLFETDFINTLLLTDYFLKFMTVGHEVNGAYPYKMRPIQEMIAHLPPHLKMIIDQFQSVQKEESAHRFWIEASPVNAFLPQESEARQDDTIRIMIPEVRMIVKKHLLRRDAGGALVDDSDEPDEGWHLYRFNALPDPQALKQLALDKHVLVFARNSRDVHFIAKGAEQVQNYNFPNHLASHLVKVNAMTADSTGAISRTDENSSYLYYLVKIMCREYKVPNHFSAEYIFAQEFTLHYNEFANCLPEFARLRELARLTVYVQLLNRVMESQQRKLTELNDILNDMNHWKERKNTIDKTIVEINQGYQRIYNEALQEAKTSITQDVNEFNLNDSRTALERKTRQSLSNTRSAIGTLNFTAHSTEVVDDCERMFQDNKTRIISEHGQQQWNFNESNIRRQCNAAKENNARELTRLKRESVHEQLLSQFDATLSDPRSIISTYVTQFMDGRPDNLMKLLVDNLYTKNLARFTASFSSFGVTSRSAEAALTSVTERDIIARTITDKNTEKLKMQRDDRVAHILGVPEKEKSELRQAIAEINHIINSLTTLGIGSHKPANELPIPPHNCTWIPASVDRQENATRLVYGGVHIQPRVHIETRMTGQTRAAVNTCYNQSNHYRYNQQNLPRATQNGHSNNYQSRMSSQPSSSAGYGGSSGGGGGSGKSGNNGSSSSSAATNVNARENLNQKLRTLEKAQRTAARTEKLPDGRTRYYGAESPAHKQGATRGAAYVTEHNTTTNRVKTWHECYDHNGNVNRVHPKSIDGQNISGQHYPPTAAERKTFVKK